MAEVAKITTALNIRQSISILLAKLFLIDFLVAAVIIFFYFLLLQGGEFFGNVFFDPPLFLTSFLLMGAVKIVVDGYVVLKWLNEYYEISSEYITHKSGIIFRKTQQYRLDHVRAMDVQDSFLGQIFNYATISLYDIRLNKYLDMYLIHNPQRYARILRTLRPHIEIKKDRVNLPFMPKEIDDDKPES